MTSLFDRREARAKIILFTCGTLLTMSACSALFAPNSANPEPAPASRTETSVKVTEEPYETQPAPEPAPSETASTEPPPPAPVEPGVTRTLAPTRGTLPKAAINEGIARGQQTFRACYEQSLKANPSLSGNINVNFVIAPDGTVPSAAALEQGTDLPDETVIECVLSAFEKLTFAEPKGGRVVVTYPVHFGPEAGNTDKQP